MTTSTGAPTAGFALLVAELVDIASRVAAMSSAGAWGQVPLAGAPSLTAELVRAGDLLAAAAVDGIGVVHASRSLPAGHVSTKRWLEVATGMSAASAGARLARARAMRDDFPLTRLAWLSGTLSEDMVRTITIGIPQALQRLAVAETPSVIAGLEAQLVPYAQEASVADVHRKLARLKIVLDPEGTDARSLAAYDEQQLTLRPVGDGYEVRGYLSKESAAALLTCLDQTVDGWFRDGSLTPEQQAVSGDDVMATGRRRMRRSHLNALALAELCEQLLDTGALGTRHQQRPHVTVTVDATEYRAGLGGELHLPGHDPVPITAAAVDRILCDADVTTILTRTPTGDVGEDGSEQVADWLKDATREVLYVGRTQRTAPPRLRKALTIRDRHCQFPGCRVAAARCHAHHVRHWKDGGPTDLDQMVLLCHGHHGAVHEARWQITPTAGVRPGQRGYWRIDPRPRPPQP